MRELLEAARGNALSIIRVNELGIMQGSNSGMHEKIIMVQKNMITEIDKFLDSSGVRSGVEHGT